MPRRMPPTAKQRDRVEWDMKPTSAAVPICLALAVASGGCTGGGEQEVTRTVNGKVQHHDPEALHRNPGYSQAVAVTGKVTTTYIGGQNAVDASGSLVGKDDIATQSEQVIRNLEIALADAGATIQHVIKWNVYIVFRDSRRYLVSTRSSVRGVTG